MQSKMTNQSRAPFRPWYNIQRLILFFILIFPISAPIHAANIELFKQNCINILARFSKEVRQSSAQSSFNYGQAILYRAAGDNLVNIEDKDSLRFMVYNVLNLNLTQGKFEVDPVTGVRARVKPPRLKETRHRVEQAQIIQELNPDIAILVEVEGLGILRSFNDELLDSRYHPMMFEGNDHRGIQIGFLIKKDLNIQIRMHSFKKYALPIQSTEGPVFSRDFPVLEIRKAGASEEEAPLLLVGGTHLKSQRDRPNDPLSTRLRTDQVNAMLEIQRLFRARYGERVPFVIGGDFNSSVDPSQLAPEFEAMANAGMQDSFDVANRTDFGQMNRRFTHSYHPHGAPTRYSQLDSLQINSDFARTGAVTEAGIYRYQDSNGHELRAPLTYDERQLNPSDHYPIWMNLSTSHLLRR